VQLSVCWGPCLCWVFQNSNAGFITWCPPSTVQSIDASLHSSSAANLVSSSLLSHFMSNPTMSMASLARTAHTGLSGPSQPFTSPPGSHVASPTSTLSHISNIVLPLSRLRHTCSVLVVPPTCSASVAPTFSHPPSNVLPRISTPGVSSANYPPHRSATPAVPSYHSSTMYSAMDVAVASRSMTAATATLYMARWLWP
jgi:hypothetical protein